MDEDALYAAAIAGDADAIAKLETQADKLNEDDETILHVESKKGNAERVRFILREFANKNLLVKLDYNEKVTALTWAAYYGHTEVAEVLIDAARHLPPPSDDDNPVTSDDDNTPENPVAPSDDETTHDDPLTSFQAFLRLGAVTALEVAVLNSKVAIVKLLVEADPSNTHTQNSEGKTQMYIAAERGYTDIVKLICTTCTALSNLDGPRGMTALHAASKNLDYGVEVVEVLISAARLLSSSSEDKHNTHSQFSSFQTFLRKGNADLNTALHIAVMEGNFATAKLLVEADPSDTVHLPNDKGETPVYIAAEKGYYDIVKMICTTCSAPSNLDAAIKNLHQAKNSGRNKIYIIKDEDALYAAAIAGDADAIAQLEMEADKLDEDNQTILHMESKKGNIERVRFILREFANKNLLVKLDNDEKVTALTWAAYYGHTEVAEVLIDAARHLPPPSPNDNPVTSDDDNTSENPVTSDDDDPVTSFQAFLRLGASTALEVAVLNNKVSIVKLLVEADPSHTHIQNDEGETPIYIAAEKGYTDIVKLLCTTCTALSNLDGPGGRTVLHAASKNLDHGVEVVEVLIGAARLLSSSSEDKHNSHSQVSSFQDFLRKPNANLNTALHIAIMEGNLATAKLLVEADPSDTHTQNYDGETPIYIAAKKGYMDIAKMICATCTVPSNLDGPHGTTALHAAIKNLDQAKKEDRDVISRIISAVKSDDNDEYPSEKLFELFNKTDENRCTILELAVERNYADIVELILAENPAYRLGNNSDFIGLMPLIYKATDKGYEDIVKLLTRQYESGFRSSSSHSHVAHLISHIRSRNRESVLGLLDKYGKTLVKFADNLGWTALHHAAYHEFDSIIHAIVEKQENFGHQFVYQDMVSTPFHVAAEKGYTSTVILLMQLWPSSSSAYIAVDKKGQNILHLAALQSKKEMIQGILNYCPETHKNEMVNKQDNSGNTPLHMLIRRGCFVPELMKYKGLDIVKKNKEKLTPPDMLYFEDQIIADQVQIKIALDGIQPDDQKKDIFLSVVLPSKREIKDELFDKQVEQMMHEKLARMKEATQGIAYSFADAIAGDSISKAALEMEADKLNEEGRTILHIESMRGHTESIRYILREFANKNLLVKLDNVKQTALHLAAHHGHTRVVEVLIDAARLLPSSSANHDDTHNRVGSFQTFIRQATGPMCNTALHVAVLNSKVAIVKLLVEADPSDRHIQNYEGKTPIYIAAENGYKDIIKVICTTCTALSLEGPGGSTTALHALIGNLQQVKEEDRDVITMIINAAKRIAEDAPHESFEALFNRTDESGCTVLELAVYGNHVNAVELILQENPAYQDGHGRKVHSLMRLIYKAIEESCSMDIVKLLSQTYEAGINSDHKGVVTLILAIKRRDRETILGLLEGNNKHLVSFADDEGWTPLHYAAYHEFDSIVDVIIEAQEDIKYQFVYKDMISTPFHVAAKYEYTSTVIRLMQMWPVSSPAFTSINKNRQNILHLAAVNNSKEMIHGILTYCPEKYKAEIFSQQDSNGNTPLHLVISNGCFISELIKYKGLDTMPKNKKGWTPREMLYFQNDIIGDQAQIKLALDDMQTEQNDQFYGKFWLRGMKKNIFESLVLPSRRERKNVLFNEYKKSQMDAKDTQMKEKLQIYKQGTNSQIVVSALITTITFTVGFTMPGGLHQSGETDEGLALLSNKAAFNAFMVLDALALLLSTCSMFIYFLESMYEDPYQVFSLHATTTVLNIVSVILMMLIFITGTYLVLSQSPALAITVCVIGSLFFLFVIVHLMKFVYARRVHKNKV